MRFIRTFLDSLTSRIALQSALLVLAALISAGCASPARSTAMVPQEFKVTSRHAVPVAVEVSGGHKTNPAWRSDISSEDFSKAIAESISKSGVFSSVVAKGDAAYQLDVTLVKLLQPVFGFDLKVTAVTEWRLTHVATKKVVSDEFISTPFTATVGDAFVAMERVRLANEGAARDNIKEGIRRLSELSLPGN